jgi:2-polyprenyl-6-methoxyphenol hydroxylase-like FAD-dependent oxidoreductase
MYAEHGLSVALIDQHADIDWHKRLCTHYIQACAVPTVRRLGLEPLLEQAGAVRSRMEIWTRWGWIRHGGPTAPETYGYSMRRQVIDPILRRLAVETPGVHALLGWTADGLVREGRLVRGVTLRDRSGATREVTAEMVVAADGRNSPLATLAKVPVKRTENGRFIYFAYYRNLRLASGDDSQFWLLDPDAAYSLVNENGITLVACWPTQNKLPAFREDRERAFREFISKLPDGPDLSTAERVGEMLGAIDLPIELRGGARGGMALVGDAALSIDPLWGVGCGWALQSAEWLVDSTAETLRRRGDIRRALTRYHRLHRHMLAGHYTTIADYASGRKFRWLEKLLFSTAARNTIVANRVLDFGARRIGAMRLFSLSTFVRAVTSRLRRGRNNSSSDDRATSSQPADAQATAAVLRR